jgi:cyanophycinase
MKKSIFIVALFIGTIPFAFANSLGRVGNSKDTLTTSEPGYLLMGGSTDVDEAIKWFLQKSGGGDIIILRASGGAGYNQYMFDLAKVNSVETLLINSREEAGSAEMIQKINNAEAIFIAGGDQWNYIQYWGNTPLQEALLYALKKKKISIGGTSAGLAVMGEYVFDARMDGVTSEEAYADMNGPKISISHRFLDISLLNNTITDSHYTQRNRMGRHLVFMLKIQQQSGQIQRGIGIDEKTALVFDEKGVGFVYGIGKVFFLQTNAYNLLSTGKPVEWDNTKPGISVYSIAGKKEGSPIPSLDDCFRQKSNRVRIQNKTLNFSESVK